MSEKGKLTVEELEKLQTQQKQYQQFITELGGVTKALHNFEVQIQRISQTKEDILKDIAFLEDKAEETQKELTEKYKGSINVDINTGEFVYVSKQ